LVTVWYYGLVDESTYFDWLKISTFEKLSHLIFVKKFQRT
jgi:hypothetical protein